MWTLAFVHPPLGPQILFLQLRTWNPRSAETRIATAGTLWFLASKICFPQHLACKLRVEKIIWDCAWGKNMAETGFLPRKVSVSSGRKREHVKFDNFYSAFLTPSTWGQCESFQLSFELCRNFLNETNFFSGLSVFYEICHKETIRNESIRDSLIHKCRTFQGSLGLCPWFDAFKVVNKRNAFDVQLDGASIWDGSAMGPPRVSWISRPLIFWVLCY